ncbi:MAG TPA: response regulator [Cyanobacteria bacterium UBA12227]|nr:response regulator [Cyanobacteria bacterium UBA12227]HAX88732.1 response regulator [Cyanobacteria bacterium UBA11370]
MQGTLNEIDIRSILQLIELGQRTGELLVEAYGSHTNTTGGDITNKSFTFNRLHQEAKPRKPGPFWFVFFLNGQIAYAANSDSSLSRLRDYLRRYKIETALDELERPSIASTNAPEYGYLWALLEKHLITPAQGRSILQSMVYETLFDLLSLHNGYFVFEISPALAPQLMTLEIAPLVTKIMKQVQEWKQFHPHIQSPHQCPIVTHEAQLRATLPENALRTLDRWADGKTSLRQMARYLNRDLLTVAKAIYPYVQQGWIQLLNLTVQETPALKQPWELASVPQTPRVVCIDDDAAIGKTVEYMLQTHGYEVKAIQNPLKALSLVFQIQPDLILCDLAMPKLDGYELCGMLRQSTAFRQTPIIMLTGKDGFIDRVRARMVGSTDYLTKPFGTNELLMLLEKYIGPGYLEKGRLDNIVTDALDLDIDGTDISESASA